MVPPSIAPEALRFPVVITPLRLLRVIIPPSAVVELAFSVPVLASILPRSDVSVISRPELMISPVEIVWLAKRVIVALFVPVKVKPVVLMEPFPTGDRNRTGALNVVFPLRLMRPLPDALPMVMLLNPGCKVASSLASRSN